ncbi:hypothetical protein ACIOWG_09305 [Streptomyces sp. NPDC087658]|uniref:hypothetical protein n=1 Tax=Streptomyces sp. NPDC087658 TaxID=3365800 RepID=UPI0038082CE1
MPEALATIGEQLGQQGHPLKQLDRLSATCRQWGYEAESVTASPAEPDPMAARASAGGMPASAETAEDPRAAVLDAAARADWPRLDAALGALPAAESGAYDWTDPARLVGRPEELLPGAEAGAETCAEAGAETCAETCTEAGTETRAEAGIEARAEAGAETCTEAARLRPRIARVIAARDAFAVLWTASEA